MYQLKVALEVTDDGSGWILISDQQKGLLNGVAMYWERADHRNCARHIYANWNKKHKGQELKEVFWKAVRAYNEPDFQYAMEEMKSLSDDAATAFMAQPTKAFCRCYFTPGCNADVVVNNMAETFNGFIIQSRAKHIIHMLEDIRIAIMTRLLQKHKEMVGKDIIICPRIQQKLDKEKGKAHHCKIYASKETLYQVQDLDDVSVDLEAKTCTCKRWDLTGIPCHHACAVLGWLQWPVENYVADCYKKVNYVIAYDRYIPPLPSAKYWPRVVFPLDPPPIKVAPGRPRKNRRKDPHEDPKGKGKLTRHGSQVTCSLCKGKGHNKKTCPNKDKPAQSTQQVKRPRGRPPKVASQQASEAAQSSQHVSRPRGRPPKAAGQTGSQGGSQHGSQQASQTGRLTKLPVKRQRKS